MNMKITIFKNSFSATILSIASTIATVLGVEYLFSGEVKYALICFPLALAGMWLASNVSAQESFDQWLSDTRRKTNIDAFVRHSTANAMHAYNLAPGKPMLRYIRSLNPQAADIIKAELKKKKKSWSGKENVSLHRCMACPKSMIQNSSEIKGSLFHFLFRLFPASIRASYYDEIHTVRNFSHGFVHFLSFLQYNYMVWIGGILHVIRKTRRLFSAYVWRALPDPLSSLEPDIARYVEKVGWSTLFRKTATCAGSTSPSSPNDASRSSTPPCRKGFSTAWSPTTRTRPSTAEREARAKRSRRPPRGTLEHAVRQHVEGAAVALGLRPSRRQKKNAFRHSDGMSAPKRRTLLARIPRKICWSLAAMRKNGLD